MDYVYIWLVVAFVIAFGSTNYNRSFTGWLLQVVKVFVIVLAVTMPILIMVVMK